MDIKWIQSFIVTAKYENVRNAAEELYLTQPAVTKHIQKLEERLQSQLFHRKGKSIHLSADGLKFLPHAQAMVQSYEEGIQSFRSWQQGFTKKITIASAPQIASSVLPAILNEFMTLNPQIEIQINIINSYNVLKEVQQGRSDIGLTRILIPHDYIKSDVLMTEKVVLVGPPNVSLEEDTALQQYRLITDNHPVYWDKLLREIHFHYEHIKTLPINQIEVTKRFIEQGIAISYLPLSLIERELAMKSVKIIPSRKISLPQSNTYLLTKESTEEVLLFCSFITKKLQNSTHTY